jgi:peptide/nickel transport system ATP-binding protein
MSIALEVENLSVWVGEHRLVGPISFAIPEGGVLVIMGETGAGKSLLAQAILGALPEALTAEGKIVLHGQRIDTLSPREREAFWGREMTMLPQEPWRALSPLKRAGDQVRETHRLVAGHSRNAARKAMREDFAALSLAGAERKLPGELSGGMAQRVAFAAARAGGAPLLLADEPTKGLDADRRDVVAGLLSGVVAKGGTVLAITHEVAVARQLGGEAMILKDGALVEAGPCAALLANPSSDYARDLLAADPSAWSAPPTVTPGAEVLRAHGLVVERGGKSLMSDFDLSLCAGERVALTGPSGSGKTSLLDVLAGLLRPAAGGVERGTDVGRTGIQKLYQDPPAAFPPHVTLKTSLRDAMRLHRIEWDKVMALLDRLKIAPSMLDRRPDAVSGGELQRIALARALSIEPTVLLADEPTSRLDPITQRETMKLIAEEAARANIAVVLVTHDHDTAAVWADRSIAIG